MTSYSDQIHAHHLTITLVSTTKLPLFQTRHINGQWQPGNTAHVPIATKACDENRDFMLSTNRMNIGRVGWKFCVFPPWQQLRDWIRTLFVPLPVTQSNVPVYDLTCPYSLHMDSGTINYFCFKMSKLHNRHEPHTLSSLTALTCMKTFVGRVVFTYKTLLLLASTWISNHMPGEVWGEITYPFLNFNGTTVEV